MATADPGYNPAIVGGGLSEADMEDYVKNLAAEDLGVTADQLIGQFHLTASRGVNGLTQVASGAATVGAGTQAKRLTSGGVGLVLWASEYSAAMTGLIVAGAAKKFWLAGYFAVNSAVAANEHIGIGTIAFATNENMLIGARGSTSVTNFVAWGDTGTAIDSGLALDNVRRLHVCFRDGTNTTYKIDGTVRGTNTCRPSVSSQPFFACVRSGAANINGDFVWAAAYTVKE